MRCSVTSRQRWFSMKVPLQKRERHQPVWPVCGTAGWVRWTILRWVSSRPCAGTNEWPYSIPACICPRTGSRMQNAVAAHTFRKRPANCEANASLRWSWSIRPANTASDLATWPLTGATARIPPFSAAWRRVHCAFWPMSTSISGSGWMIPLPIDLPLRAVGVLHRSGAPTGPRWPWPNGRRSSRSLPGSGSNCARARKARWRRSICTLGYGHGIARKKPHATGICWCAGNVVPTRLRTLCSPTPMRAPRYPVWHACTVAASSSSTPSGRPRASWPWRIIRCVAGMPGIATWRWSWLPCCFCSRSA